MRKCKIGEEVLDRLAGPSGEEVLDILAGSSGGKLSYQVRKC